MISKPNSYLLICMYCKDRAVKGVPQHQSIPGLTESHAHELKTTAINPFLFQQSLNVWVAPLLSSIVGNGATTREQFCAEKWGVTLQQKRPRGQTLCWHCLMTCHNQSSPWPSPAPASIPTSSELHHSWTLLGFFFYPTRKVNTFWQWNTESLLQRIQINHSLSFKIWHPAWHQGRQSLHHSSGQK